MIGLKAVACCTAARQVQSSRRAASLIAEFCQQVKTAQINPRRPQRDLAMDYQQHFNRCGYIYSGALTPDGGASAREIVFDLFTSSIIGAV